MAVTLAPMAPSNKNCETIGTVKLGCTLPLVEFMFLEQQVIFLERAREGHCQSDEHWNCFKGNVGETAERWAFLST